MHYSREEYFETQCHSFGLECLPQTHVSTCCLVLDAVLKDAMESLGVGLSGRSRSGLVGIWSFKEFLVLVCLQLPPLAEGTIIANAAFAQSGLPATVD